MKKRESYMPLKSESKWMPIYIPPKEKKEYMVKNITGSESIAYWNGLFFVWRGVDVVLTDVVAYKNL